MVDKLSNVDKIKTPVQKELNELDKELTNDKKEGQEVLAKKAQHQKAINKMIEYLESEGIKERPQDFLKVPGSAFLKRNAKDIDTLFLTEKDGEFIVDFHKNRGADRYVGIGDTSYAEKDVVVKDAGGKEHLGVRKIINGKVGYENIDWPSENPRYLAIHKGYSFRNTTEEDWKVLGKGKIQQEFFENIDFPTSQDEEKAKKEFIDSIEISEVFAQNPGRGLEAIAEIKGGFAEKIKGTAEILGIDPNLMLATIDKESTFRSHVTRREAHVVRRSLKRGFSREESEIMGTSYGYFQILGEGYATMGYETPQEFESAVTGDLSSQLEVYSRYVRTKPGMLAALQAKDFQRIAYLYNGAGYAQNNYDNDLREKYTQFSKAA